MAIILSYIFYFIAASVSPLQRRWLAVNRDVDERSQINFSFRVVLFLVAGSLILPFFSPFFLKGNSSTILLLAICAGLFGAVSFITIYIAQKHVEAGVSSVVANIYTPFTIILASIFLNEGLTSMQIIGTTLLLIGIVIVSKKHRTGRFTFDKYFILMIFGGIAISFVIVAERALQKMTGFTAGTMISWWSQCLFLGLATLIFKSKNQYSTKDITVTGILRFLQALSWVVLIYVVGNLSLVSAVTTFKIVVVFIAAAIFLHERQNFKRKLLGSIIALIGLLLM